MHNDIRSPRWRPLVGARAVTKNTNQEARLASVMVWASGRNEARRGKKTSK